MIVGQITIDGLPFSRHRYTAGHLNTARVRQMLAEFAVAEQLHKLGRVEISAQALGGLERLMAALWGPPELEPPPSIDLPTPEPWHDTDSTNPAETGPQIG